MPQDDNQKDKAAETNTAAASDEKTAPDAKPEAKPDAKQETSAIVGGKSTVATSPAEGLPGGSAVRSTSPAPGVTQEEIAARIKEATAAAEAEISERHEVLEAEESEIAKQKQAIEEKMKELETKERRVNAAAELGIAVGQLPEDFDVEGEESLKGFWQISYPGSQTRVIPRPDVIARKKRRPFTDFEALGQYHGVMGITGSSQKPTISRLDPATAVAEMMKEKEATGRPLVTPVEDQPGLFTVKAAGCPRHEFRAESELDAAIQYINKLAE